MRGQSGSMKLNIYLVTCTNIALKKKKKEQCQGLYGFNCQHAVPAHRMQLTPIYLRYAANDLYSQL